MKTRPLIATIILSALAIAGAEAQSTKGTRPNIVFIMSDDQGYSEASCYNTESPLRTPGIDRIAAEGIRFTDAHSGSAVCSPTRYGLMTGRYSWRSSLQKGVMSTGKDNLIADERLTVAEMLRDAGYFTALVGKWHLGYRYQVPPGTEFNPKKRITETYPYGENTGCAEAPVGSKVINGPLKHGFDFVRGFHHAREMRSWTVQDEVVENINSIEMLPRLTKTAVELIERFEKKEQPFFLYVPFGSPHKPTVPSLEWVGRSGINLFADYVMQTDDAVGQILDALDRTHQADNTIVFFTSDNGTSTTAKFDQLLAKGHNPNHALTGHKLTIWDGGHRVPYVVRWPGKIKAGTVTDEIICHNNLMATCAEIVEIKIPDGQAEDSFSILPVLKGEQLTTPTHPYVIHHSNKGHFAIRQGDWKFIAAEGSGGDEHDGDGQPSQLYNMSKDLKEQNNLVQQMPEKATQFLTLLEDAIEAGRSTPGSRLSNDVPVDLWKKNGEKSGKNDAEKKTEKTGRKKKDSDQRE